MLTFDRIIPLHGDRVSGNDDAARIGLAWVGGKRCAFVRFDGSPLTMTQARQVARLISVAEQTKVPVVLTGAFAVPEGDSEATRADTERIGVLLESRVAVVRVAEPDESDDELSLYDVVVVTNAGTTHPN
ncbi:MAG: hypothetical protein O3A46_14380, partial [Candidatus Poribacteria bacterium]|nr:hypothetical protein [Candidatus Poribacteria bacterium]